MALSIIPVLGDGYITIPYFYNCNHKTPLPKPIPIGISPRHIHPSNDDFEKLFGQGAFLNKRQDLTQGGQFAAEQMVAIATALGKIEPVRILGPFRKNTQVELSMTDAVLLELNPPVRDSGQHEGSPGITVIGPSGTIELKRGVIIAQRHIHMTPTDAREFMVQDKDIVWTAVQSVNRSGTESAGRKVIFGDVIIRIDPSFKLDFHLDTDEANAAGVQTGDIAHIIKDMDMQNKDTGDKIYPRKRVYSEWDVRKAHKEGKIIIVEKGTILTPSAKDYGKLWNVFKKD